MDTDLAFVSDADPLERFEKEIPPEGFLEFRRGLALAGWIPNPLKPIGRFFSALGLPIQIPAEDFFFGAARAAADSADTKPWELILKIRTPTAAQARSFLSVFSMAKLLFTRSFSPAGSGFDEDAFSSYEGPLTPLEAASLLFANQIEQDEDWLTLRMSGLTENRMALLFGMFGVYSN
jgi:hypothetical protein